MMDPVNPKGSILYALDVARVMELNVKSVAYEVGIFYMLKERNVRTSLFSAIGMSKVTEPEWRVRHGNFMKALKMSGMMAVCAVKPAKRSTISSHMFVETMYKIRLCA